MSDKAGGRPLPKFGEWDVNDPASAEGFTAIFTKARDEKKTGPKPDSQHYSPQPDNNPPKPSPKKWICCMQTPRVDS